MKYLIQNRKNSIILQTVDMSKDNQVKSEECPAQGHFLPTFRGREPGRSPRAEGERISADECKQHDCDHKVIARSFKNAQTHKIYTKLMHIEVFCNLL